MMYFQLVSFCRSYTTAVEPIKTQSKLNDIDNQPDHGIMRDYLTKREKRTAFDDEITASLYEKLKNIDENLTRPLFAVILADAWLEHPGEVLKWSWEDVLAHIYLREMRFLEELALDFDDEKTELCAILPRIMMMAIMTGGLCLETDLELLLLDDYEDIKLLFPTNEKQRRFFSIPALFAEQPDGTHVCSALEPDIIGEYFALTCWRKSGSRTGAYIKAA